MAKQQVTLHHTRRKVTERINITITYETGSTQIAQSDEEPMALEPAPQTLDLVQVLTQAIAKIQEGQDV